MGNKLENYVGFTQYIICKNLIVLRFFLIALYWQKSIGKDLSIVGVTHKKKVLVILYTHK